MSGIWYGENDHSLALDGLKNGLTDSYINNATVQAELLDNAGSQIAGVVQPITLEYVTDSDGKYRATINKVLDVDPRDRIVAKITAVASGPLNATWEEQVSVIKRRSL